MKNQKVLIWLKKARTSLDKIIKMVEDDKYCIDIIQQNLAVIWLLKSANMNLLESHMNCCVKNAFNSKDEVQIDEKIWELVKVLKLAQDK
jgi:CsoR family transcriptional regulator, copper-sensing transcriptional repressor